MAFKTKKTRTIALSIMTWKNDQLRTIVVRNVQQNPERRKETAVDNISGTFLVHTIPDRYDFIEWQPGLTHRHASMK